VIAIRVELWYDASMSIRSALFIKSIVEDDPLLLDEKPKVAFIGRSNVGKSSVINALTGQKDLAHTSSLPGRTKEINVFLINHKCYLIDLPGYGFAHASHTDRKNLQQLIAGYLFSDHYEQQLVVLIIDALIGVTAIDMEMLVELEAHHKNILIVANKIDKLNKSDRNRCLQKIKDRVGTHPVILFSALKKIGVGLLSQEILR
jgi:GTP-binding protein